jgi:hypothetical protein
LLRLGKNAQTQNLDSTLFFLQGIHFYHQSHHVAHLTCPEAELDGATFVCLELTIQKN